MRGFRYTYECTGWYLLDLGNYSRLVSPIDEVLLKVSYIFSIVEKAGFGRGGAVC